MKKNSLGKLLKNKYAIGVASVALAVIVIVGISTFAGNSNVFVGKKLTRFNTSKKVMALTFDDGPTDLTPEVLTMLKAEGVHATFFMVAEKAKAHPELVRAAVSSGNEVGSHADTHVPMNFSTASQCDAQIDAANTIFEAPNILGAKPLWFRSPYNNISQTCLTEVNNKGQYYAYQLNSPNDPNANLTPAQIGDHAFPYIKPGAIILFHPEDHKNSIEAARIFIRKAKSEGYKFETLSQLASETNSSTRTVTLPIVNLVAKRTPVADEVSGALTATITSPTQNASVTYAGKNMVTVSANKKFKQVRIFINDANGKEVGDTQWKATNFETTYSKNISEIAKKTLKPGRYYTSADVVGIDGAKAATKRYYFNIK